MCTLCMREVFMANGGKKVLVKFYFAAVIAPYHCFPLDLAVTVIVTINWI